MELTIKELCEELKLSTVLEQYHSLSSMASKENWTYRQFLNELL